MAKVTGKIIDQYNIWNKPANSRSDVKHFINSIKTIFNNGAFFNYFKRVRSLADGYCIIHSIISCLCAKYGTFESSVNDLLCKLKNECYENIYEYMPFFDNDYNSFFNHMHEYVDAKSYNTSFCDLVPFMMSNILNEVIVIIDENINDTFVTVLSPRNSRAVKLSGTGLDYFPVENIRSLWCLYSKAQPGLEGKYPRTDWPLQ